MTAWLVPADDDAVGDGAVRTSEWDYQKTAVEPDGSPAPKDDSSPCRELLQHSEEPVLDGVESGVVQEEPQPHRLGLLEPVLATGCRPNLTRTETEW